MGSCTSSMKARFPFEASDEAVATEGKTPRSRKSIEAEMFTEHPLPTVNANLVTNHINFAAARDTKSTDTNEGKHGASSFERRYVETVPSDPQALSTQKPVVDTELEAPSKLSMNDIEAILRKYSELPVEEINENSQEKLDNAAKIGDEADLPNPFLLHEETESNALPDALNLFSSSNIQTPEVESYLPEKDNASSVTCKEKDSPEPAVLLEEPNESEDAAAHANTYGLKSQDETGNNIPGSEPVVAFAKHVVIEKDVAAFTEAEMLGKMLKEESKPFTTHKFDLGSVSEKPLVALPEFPIDATTSLHQFVLYPNSYRIPCEHNNVLDRCDLSFVQSGKQSFLGVRREQPHLMENRTTIPLPVTFNLEKNSWEYKNSMNHKPSIKAFEISNKQAKPFQPQRGTENSRFTDDRNGLDVWRWSISNASTQSRKTPISFSNKFETKKYSKGSGFESRENKGLNFNMDPLQKFEISSSGRFDSMSVLLEDVSKMNGEYRNQTGEKKSRDQTPSLDTIYTLAETQGSLPTYKEWGRDSLSTAIDSRAYAQMKRLFTGTQDSLDYESKGLAMKRDSYFGIDASQDERNTHIEDDYFVHSADGDTQLHLGEMPQDLSAAVLDPRLDVLEAKGFIGSSHSNQRNWQSIVKRNATVATRPSPVVNTTTQEITKAVSLPNFVNAATAVGNSVRAKIGARHGTWRCSNFAGNFDDAKKGTETYSSNLASPTFNVTPSGFFKNQFVTAAPVSAKHMAEDLKHLSKAHSVTIDHNLKMLPTLAKPIAPAATKRIKLGGLNEDFTVTTLQEGPTKEDSVASMGLRKNCGNKSLTVKKLIALPSFSVNEGIEKGRLANQSLDCIGVQTAMQGMPGLLQNTTLEATDCSSAHIPRMDSVVEIDAVDAAVSGTSSRLPRIKHSGASRMVEDSSETSAKSFYGIVARHDVKSTYFCDTPTGASTDASTAASNCHDLILDSVSTGKADAASGQKNWVTRMGQGVSRGRESPEIIVKATNLNTTVPESSSLLSSDTHFSPLENGSDSVSSCASISQSVDMGKDVVEAFFAKNTTQAPNMASPDPGDSPDAVVTPPYVLPSPLNEAAVAAPGTVSDIIEIEEEVAEEPVVEDFATVPEVATTDSVDNSNRVMESMHTLSSQLSGTTAAASDIIGSNHVRGGQVNESAIQDVSDVTAVELIDNLNKALEILPVLYARRKNRFLKASNSVYADMCGRSISTPDAVKGVDETGDSIGQADSYGVIERHSSWVFDDAAGSVKEEVKSVVEGVNSSFVGASETREQTLVLETIASDGNISAAAGHVETLKQPRIVTDSRAITVSNPEIVVMGAIEGTGMDLHKALSTRVDEDTDFRAIGVANETIGMAREEVVAAYEELANTLRFRARIETGTVQAHIMVLPGDSGEASSQSSGKDTGESVNESSIDGVYNAADEDIEEEAVGVVKKLFKLADSGDAMGEAVASSDKMVGWTAAPKEAVTGTDAVTSEAMKTEFESTEVINEASIAASAAEAKLLEFVKVVEQDIVVTDSVVTVADVGRQRDAPIAGTTNNITGKAIHPTAAGVSREEVLNLVPREISRKAKEAPSVTTVDTVAKRGFEVTEVTKAEVVEISDAVGAVASHIIEHSSNIKNSTTHNIVLETTVDVVSVNPIPEDKDLHERMGIAKASDASEGAAKSDSLAELVPVEIVEAVEKCDTVVTAIGAESAEQTVESGFDQIERDTDGSDVTGSFVKGLSPHVAVEKIGTGLHNFGLGIIVPDEENAVGSPDTEEAYLRSASQGLSDAPSSERETQELSSASAMLEHSADAISNSNFSLNHNFIKDGIELFERKAVKEEYHKVPALENVLLHAPVGVDETLLQTLQNESTIHVQKLQNSKGRFFQKFMRQIGPHATPSFINTLVRKLIDEVSGATEAQVENAKCLQRLILHSFDEEEALCIMGAFHSAAPTDWNNIITSEDTKQRIESLAHRVFNFSEKEGSNCSSLLITGSKGSGKATIMKSVAAKYGAYFFSFTDRIRLFEQRKEIPFEKLFLLPYKLEPCLLYVDYDDLSLCMEEWAVLPTYFNVFWQNLKAFLDHYKASKGLVWPVVALSDHFSDLCKDLSEIMDTRIEIGEVSSDDQKKLLKEIISSDASSDEDLLEEILQSTGSLSLGDLCRCSTAVSILWEMN